MIPGEIKVSPGEILLNEKRKAVQVSVTNTGDRPIQVGSHYHFFETNEALQFERRKAYGFRLNIAAGTAGRLLTRAEKSGELRPGAGGPVKYHSGAAAHGE